MTLMLIPTRLAALLGMVCLLCLPGCGSQPAGGTVIAPAATTPPLRAAAGTTASASPPGPIIASGPLRTDPFGGARWGFVEATSASGRFVVLRRFAGDARPSFGQHGESATPTDVAIFDRLGGAEHAIDEIVDVDASRRLFLVLEHGQVSVADAGSGKYTPLPQADMTPDGNACLPPRQATFSEAGGRVAWVVGDALHVRALATGEEWSVTSKARLWRGWSDDDGRGAVLAEVPLGTTGWPHQNTSCACRWCGRFAMSYGLYGWSGPAFAIEHAAADGTRTSGDGPKGHPWTGKTDAGCSVVADSSDHELDRGPWRFRCGTVPTDGGAGD